MPEAVAFAFVAGVDPLVGLYGAFMMGLITSLFGGRPGMISGATGAMAVVMVHLIQKGNQVGISLDTPIENLGLKWLFITLLIVGGIQITAGIFKLGKFGGGALLGGGLSSLAQLAQEGNEGELNPLFEASPKDVVLKGFNWRAKERPNDMFDLFIR